MMLWALMICTTPQYGVFIWTFPGEQTCREVGRYPRSVCYDGALRFNLDKMNGWDSASYRRRWEMLTAYAICRETTNAR